MIVRNKLQEVSSKTPRARKEEQVASSCIIQQAANIQQQPELMITLTSNEGGPNHDIHTYQILAAELLY